ARLAAAAARRADREPRRTDRGRGDASGRAPLPRADGGARCPPARPAGPGRQGAPARLRGGRGVRPQATGDPQVPLEGEGGPTAPVGRTLAIARPAAGRLALATLLGACSMAAAIGLIATSAWLISRSSQRPPESAVALAIVGVQFFALSRGLCRYGERLV